MVIMSPSKKGPVAAPQNLFESIMELISRTKPLLDNPKEPSRLEVIKNLHQVASLAESFIEQRQRSSKSISHLLDVLDQEGVNLWNISGLIRTFPDDDTRTLIAALRLAAFRLVEAGLEAKPGIDSLLHVLQLASKTGTTLSELGNNAIAGRVLMSAAGYEEQLRSSDDPDGTHRQPILCATIVYLSSRMEAAWKEGNYTVAELMSRKITDDDQPLALLPPHTRQHLALKLYQIGSSILKEPDGNRSTDSIQWLQKAFAMVDRLEDAATPGVAELKISVLRTMARAYFLSGSYDRAEATLEELIPTIDVPSNNATPEYQELRWLRLAVLKRRKAGDPALLDAFKSIIDHMEVTESSITDVLQDLRTLCHNHSLVTAVNQHCLQRLLRRHGPGPDYVDRLLLSLIFHCAKDEDHDRAIKTLEATFTSVCEAEVELHSIATTACLTLIWQYGGRHYRNRKWLEAADWFLTGSHKLFGVNSPSIRYKCYRKAALCYIELKEYARASTVIRRCPTNEPTTNYVIFLTAVHQGLEEEGLAIRAIQDIQKSPDFDRKMLLLATQISHQSEMKAVLLSALEALLNSLKAGTSGEAVVEAMTLIRCIIKLVIKLMSEPLANRSALIDTVVNHFRTARTLAEGASAQKATSLIFKDISWLWRTAYNCAVQGCSDWEHCEDKISDLFDIASDLLKISCEASPVDADSELCLHLINASFAAISGRVFSAREKIESTGSIDANSIRVIAAEIKSSKIKIIDLSENSKIQDETDRTRVQYFIHVLRVFETEFLAQIKDWVQLSEVISEVLRSGPLTVNTYEAIADILWANKDCPIDVLHSCLEAILRASLDHNSISVIKFARWLRAICTIVLARNTPEDRMKAIGYVEQAIVVITEHNVGDESYPTDERQWLLGTSYNTGIECLHASLLDESKRWFEVSTIICRFVPGGKERAEKISETYTHLLSRFTSRN